MHAVGATLVDPAIGEAGDIDAAMVTLVARSGALCQIDNSRRCAYGYDQRIEAFGDLGRSAENMTATAVRASNASSTKRRAGRWTSSSSGTGPRTVRSSRSSSPRRARTGAGGRLCRRTCSARPCRGSRGKRRDRASRADRSWLRRSVAPPPRVRADPGWAGRGRRPASAGWEYLWFEAFRLHPGRRIERAAGDVERLVLILEGSAAVTAGGRDFGVLGTRETGVRSGPPPAVVLIEPGLDASIVGATTCLVVVAAAPAGATRARPRSSLADIQVEQRGSGATARRVHHLLPTAAQAGRLIAFEVFTPGGNWSSYPPHKHDTDDPPREAGLEELYCYRFAHPRPSRSPASTRPTARWTSR